MGEKSKIEWTDHTFNPWWGCWPVSAGCRNCYAAALAKRTGYGYCFGVNDVNMETAATHSLPAGTYLCNGDGETIHMRREFGNNHWQEPHKWNAAAEKAGKPALVFCGSMCDVFEPLPGLDKQRERLWDMIEDTPWLRWLLLTKRPERVFPEAAESWLQGDDWWPKNVAIGTTIENQQVAEERLLHLTRIPAAMRFVSCEPLLGPVDLRLFDSMVVDAREPAFGGEGYGRDGKRDNAIDWVIAGGESGTKARPPHPDWFRSLRDQCQEAGVPFLFKQWGEWQNGSDRDKRTIFMLNDGSIYKPGDVPTAGGSCFDREIEAKHQRDWPKFKATTMARVGKKKAGRELDGEEWLEFPKWCEKEKA